MEMWREPATPCAAGANTLRGGRLTPLPCPASETLTERPHFAQFPCPVQVPSQILLNVLRRPLVDPRRRLVR